MKQIMFGIIIVMMVGLVLAAPHVKLKQKVTITNTVNSSDFWDALNDPSDISGSVFWYNHTLAVVNTYGDNYLSTYNVSYDSANGNASWNQSFANELYVPYTGATSNVNLGNNNITANFSFFDYVSIGTTNSLHSLEILGDFLLTHVATGTDEHGLELNIDAAGFGDVKGIDIVYNTGAIADGQDEAAILISLDTSNSTGGEVAGLEILRTGNTAMVDALLTGIEINPVRQLSGVFENMDSLNNSGVDNLAEFISTASDIEFFTNDNDYVTIGFSTHFEEVEFILDTEASINVKPTFEYSTGVGTWATFTPIDGTNGFENTGVILWLVSDIPSWTTGTGGEYLIRITRTKNNIMTAPIEDLVQISDVTEYYWDKEGDLLIRNLNATQNITTDYYLGDGSYLTGILNEWDSNICWINESNTFSSNQDLDGNNLTTVDCLVFESGGKICSGS